MATVRPISSTPYWKTFICRLTKMGFNTGYSVALLTTDRISRLVKEKPRAGNLKSNRRMAQRLGRHCWLLRRATWLK
jgi:hypothetical protein